MRPARPIFAALVLTLSFARHSTQAAPTAESMLASGFADESVATLATGDIPTALSTTPDGRVLVGLKTGTLRIVENGALRAQPALTLNPICTDGERGLQSVTPDPAFASNNYVKVFYTAPASPISRRVFLSIIANP
jgi:glucose/arabinose dehydrogenase